MRPSLQDEEHRRHLPPVCLISIVLTISGQYWLDPGFWELGALVGAALVLASAMGLTDISGRIWLANGRSTPFQVRQWQPWLAAVLIPGLWLFHVAGVFAAGPAELITLSFVLGIAFGQLWYPLCIAAVRLRVHWLRSRK